MREPSLQRPHRSIKRTVRTDGLIILSGEDLLFADADAILRGIHLPLFEAHFGPVWPREALDASWRLSSFDRGGGSGARLARLAAMLSRLASASEESDRRRDFADLARALWSWLAISRSPSTGSLARFIAGRGELAKALVPVLSFSVDLDARLRALRLPGCRPGLRLLQSVLPASLSLAAVTGLPVSVVGSVEGIGRFWRIWDDGLRSPATTLASDLGIARSLADAEIGSRPRFGGGRLLLIGTRDGDRRLAKALGADFVEVRSGLEEEALVGLARGFATLRPRVAEAPASP